MEVEWFENVANAEEILQIDADNDASMSEAERCGLCMLVIFDRGVLDCCQHWFCFKCIDNWSTITNVCPLCHNEFQLITCVPVYDIIGGNNTDEDPLSGNADWSIEGTNNTLSFPSYYIDENAVTCSDGDGCKLRSGSVTLDENLGFDMSIACDSCDTWYHAFCVGFDAESTSDDSWLCPRCLVVEAPTLDANATELAQDYCNSRVNNLSSANAFSGKVSISVADDGETAMVVSLVDQRPIKVETPARSLITQGLEFDKEDNINQSRWATSESSSDHSPALLGQSITNDLPSSNGGDIGLSISNDRGLGTAPIDNNSVSNFEDNVMFNQHNVSSIKCCESNGKRTSEDDAILRPDEGSVMADCANDNAELAQVVGAGIQQHCSLLSNSCHSSADGSTAQADVPVFVGEKRRRKGHSTSAHASARKRVRFATEGLSGETNAEKNEEGTAVDLSDSVALNISQAVRNDTIISSRNNCVLESAEEMTTLDIMNIVQGTESKLLGSNPAKKLSERRDAAGPRVKKIMRRPVEDKVSSVMVQNLRKEIREAIGEKSSEDVGKNIFDGKLLAAFRAAVAVPDVEPLKKVSSASVVKTNRLMLQKSKTRENLTKKIYATASGKRRHAWYRDREVEFWKHRCLKTAKLETVDTLKSVLSRLKPDPEAKEAEKNPKEGSNSILSRLYLADASVLPRKDDIKPLTALESSSAFVSTLTEETAADKFDKTPSLSIAPLKRDCSLPDNKKSKSISSRMKMGIVSKKVAQTGAPDNSVCLSRGSKKNIHKGKIGKFDDINTDKKKWALQVLARKTASNSTNQGHQKQEDSALKVNYPLLAQLPVDMRPKVESCHHNKIASSVRQAQLHCLAENLLMLTNISPIRKTAATELAVADAINIEREIASRSNSKAVYLSLCSQELRRRKSTYSQSKVEDPNPSTLLTVSTEAEPSISSPYLDPEVEKALKSAGLLPDSPPSTTDHRTENLKDDDEEEAIGKGPENVLEMDVHPDLDIYGEFEYNIEDEDYIRSSAIQDSKLPTEEGVSKMKVVFSTLSTGKKETALNSETLERPIDALLSSRVSQSDCKTDTNGGSLSKVYNEESLSLSPGSTAEGAEEPTPTECEELYGPDKEPFFETIPFNNPGLNSSEVESGKQEDPSDSDSKVDTNAQAKESKNNAHTDVNKKQQHVTEDSVTKKVQSYIKEHIRPLCKSGVITVEQYRWAVGKTTDKVMKYHCKAKNANFLIKEGEKVKKLAEQYVEAANLKGKDK